MQRQQSGACPMDREKYAAGARVSPKEEATRKGEATLPIDSRSNVRARDK